MALYQYFWVSLLFSVIVMICYLFIYEKHESGRGLLKTMKLWFSSFRRSSVFRLLFFLVFYSAMIAFRTLLGREFFKDPLQNIAGGWELFSVSGGKVTATNGIENIILFIPFSFLLFWFINKRKNGTRVVRSFFAGILSALVFSVVIEMSQLWFCLGTFQVSDIVYNTLGGIAGSLAYLICFGVQSLRRKIFC